MYSVIVADENPSATAFLAEIVRNKRPIKQIYQAADVETIKQVLRDKQPDFGVFNIEMQGACWSSPTTEIPLPLPVIFIASEKAQAARAFDLQASDFILQPVSPLRLDQGLNKVIKHLNDKKDLSKLRLVDASQILKDLNAKSPAPKLVIRETRKVRLIEQSEIKFVKAAGNYVEIHFTNGKKIMHRGTLLSIEKRLDSAEFCRIHKSTVIKTSLVTEMNPQPKGDYRVVLKSGDELVLSRTYKDKLSIIMQTNAP